MEQIAEIMVTKDVEFYQALNRLRSAWNEAKRKGNPLVVEIWGKETPIEKPLLVIAEGAD